MILQALNGYYERMSTHADSRIAPPGFSYQPISFAIVLAADGRVVDIDDLRESDGKKTAPAITARSATAETIRQDRRRRASCGIRQDMSSALKRSNDEAATSSRMRSTARASATIIKDCSASDRSTDLQRCAQIPRLLATGRVRHASSRNRDDRHQCRVSSGWTARDSFTTHRPLTRLWLAGFGSGTKARPVSASSAARRPIARLHPVDQGRARRPDVRRLDRLVQSGRVHLLRQGAGRQRARSPSRPPSPTRRRSTSCLRRDSKQKVQIGDATTVFWAESDDDGVAAAAEQVFGFLVEPSAERADDGGDRHACVPKSWSALRRAGRSKAPS